MSFIIQPFVQVKASLIQYEATFVNSSTQMIGGFLHPGKPMANMYFVLFSYSPLLNHAFDLVR